MLCSILHGQTQHGRQGGGAKCRRGKRHRGKEGRARGLDVRRMRRVAGGKEVQWGYGTEVEEEAAEAGETSVLFGDSGFWISLCRRNIPPRRIPRAGALRSRAAHRGQLQPARLLARPSRLLGPYPGNRAKNSFRAPKPSPPTTLSAAPSSPTPSLPSSTSPNKIRDSRLKQASQRGGLAGMRDYEKKPAGFGCFFVPLCFVATRPLISMSAGGSFQWASMFRNSVSPFRAGKVRQIPLWLCWRRVLMLN